MVDLPFLSNTFVARCHQCWPEGQRKDPPQLPWSTHSGIGSQRSTSGRLERVPEESALGIRLLFTLFSRTDFADCVTAPGGAPYLRLVIASPRRRVLWTYMIRNTGGGSFERCRFICASTKQWGPVLSSISIFFLVHPGTLNLAYVSLAWQSYSF